MLKISIAIVFIFTALPLWASAAETYQTAPAATSFFEQLVPSTTLVKVQKVIDPVSFIGVDKNIYRLTGLDFPGLSESGPNDSKDLTEQATKFLKDLIEDRDLKIYQTKNRNRGRVNRMEQALVQAQLEKSNIWVQGEILTAGFARVVTQADNPELVNQMLKFEDAARSAKKGLWADAKYQIRTPDSIAGHENSFQIVEGKIVAAALLRNMLYLNFGNDWKSDFTIGIPTTVRTAMVRAGIDPQQLARSDIRVRGWVQSYNGPYIELTDAQQIEILKGRTPLLEQLPMAATGTSGPVGMQTIHLKPVAKPDVKKPEIAEPAEPKLEIKKTIDHANP